MTRISILICVVLASAVGRTAPADTVAASLSEFFAPGVVFQDRNSDGAIDFVDARLVLGERPSSAELAAAADVAARLGFETSALDLPMVRLKPDTTDDGARRLQLSETSGATIFIGAQALARAGVSLETIGVTGLKPGDGLVSAFTLSGRPAVAVVGDDGGISSAAIMLAGHLPFVWDQ